MILQSGEDATSTPRMASADDRPSLPVPVVTGHHAHAEPLDVRARRLFATLPYAFRLSLTRQHFPHVLNRIAAEWEVPRRFLALMDDLLIDRRGNREGFPFESVL